MCPEKEIRGCNFPYGDYIKPTTAPAKLIKENSSQRERSINVSNDRAASLPLGFNNHVTVRGQCTHQMIMFLWTTYVLLTLHMMIRWSDWEKTLESVFCMRAPRHRQVPAANAPPPHLCSPVIRLKRQVCVGVGLCVNMKWGHPTDGLPASEGRCWFVDEVMVTKKTNKSYAYLWAFPCFSVSAFTLKELSVFLSEAHQLNWTSQMTETIEGR